MGCGVSTEEERNKDTPYEIEDRIKSGHIVSASDWGEDGDEDLGVKEIEIDLIKEGGTNARGLSYADVVANVGVPACGKVSQQCWSCIDGRDSDPVFATPGGDAGEFLLLLNMLPLFGITIVSKEMVALIFEAYVTYSTCLPNRHFYMHTDTHVEHKISERFGGKRKSLGDDGSISIPLSGHEEDHHLPDDHHSEKLDLTQPPPADIFDDLLTSLSTDPDFIGCGHLKLQLKFPNEYQVSSTVLSWFLEAFYRRLWAGDQRLILKVLSGDHSEASVVFVTQQRSMGLAPLLVPRKGNSHMFLIHETAIKLKRRRSATFINSIAPSITPISALQKINAVARTQLDATALRLAGDLPVFKVNIIYAPRMTKAYIGMQKQLGLIDENYVRAHVLPYSQQLLVKANPTKGQTVKISASGAKVLSAQGKVVAGLGGGGAM
mmetsp:Transcript_18343/g.30141  ORF Transcript_18343/g.30141 Transcript_18343/m.30141 type:complete len:435 (+) Transcript_18343:196-1500(+)|eukprot:CAMPEP_0184663454 /NCGR_PEP_ID=MMETSP0308-20130426/48134_1 /TAXON_ID=38269 /ORGANISM="Gloeochaete witrockiana, Strain SAG 46.84" /LENGTH=434 /DNA_ID=CAMNT_0027106191 /DNA_START=101 /DNA_END=1405 /DNA_ORIENTATION=-